MNEGVHELSMVREDIGEIARDEETNLVKVVC
jgi:hypothetical protein